MSTKKPAAKAAAKKPEPKHPAPVAAKVEKAAPELPPEVLADPQLTYPPREA